MHAPTMAEKPADGKTVCFAMRLPKNRQLSQQLKKRAHKRNYAPALNNPMKASN